MASIKGYTFSKEADAFEAQNKCDQYYGIPKHPDDLTQHWTGYYFAQLNEPQFWYINYHESLLPVLGEPVDFELIERTL